MNKFLEKYDLKCPDKELECLLKDLICKFSCDKDQQTLILDSNGITITDGNTITPVQVASLIKQILTTSLSSTSLQLNLQGQTPISVNLCPVVKSCETKTEITDFKVSGTNLVISFKNESGLVSDSSLPISDICAMCSSCIEVGNTASYTASTIPASGNPGQIIFVTDQTATDGSMGTPKIWHPNTGTWKRIMIS
jgi:hypothetical protein